MASNIRQALLLVRQRALSADAAVAVPAATEAAAAGKKSFHLPYNIIHLRLLHLNFSTSFSSSPSTPSNSSSSFSTSDCFDLTLAGNPLTSCQRSTQR